MRRVRKSWRIQLTNAPLGTPWALNAQTSINRGWVHQLSPYVIFSLSRAIPKSSRFFKFFRHRSHFDKDFDLSFSLNFLFFLKMNGAEGQRATSPPSVQISWSSDEVEVVGTSGRSEPPRTSILACSQGAPSRQTHSSGRENLPMDELPSIFQETEL